MWGAREDGMIGYEFFARFITRFDYGKRTITFFDKRYFDATDAGVLVPIRLYHQFPEVLGSYDGIPARFGIDTGSRMALMLTGPFVQKHDLRARAQSGVEAMTGWGVDGPSRSFVTHGGVVKLGDVTIDRPLTALSLDKGGAGAAEAFPNNIGGGVLKRFVVTLDYDHNVMYLKPVEGPIADLDTFDRSGMWINQGDAGFKVIDVTKGAPADAAGLKVGDQIVAVDEKTAAGLDLVALRDALRNKPAGTIVTFTVKRGDTIKDLRVTLRDLI
jgi:membrane-associated protease RseP (regulator of RpoE activity)